MFRPFVSTAVVPVIVVARTGPFHPHQPPQLAIVWLSTRPSSNCAVMVTALAGWSHIGHLPK